MGRNFGTIGKSLSITFLKYVLETFLKRLKVTHILSLNFKTLSAWPGRRLMLSLITVVVNDISVKYRGYMFSRNSTLSLGTEFPGDNPKTTASGHNPPYTKMT